MIRKLLRESMIIVSICAVLAACSTSVFARTEAVLSWDDGEPDAYCGYPEAIKVAVWFQAPEWATSVVAVHVWFGGEWSPPFTVWLLRASGEWPYEPGPPGSDGFASGPVPGGTWSLVSLPDPVDISNPAHFPDRVFFASIEWETQAPDGVGVDTDPPVDGKSLVSNGSGWEWYELGDLMIRAVVSDSTGTPVELQTWGGLKSRYGRSRLPN